MNNDSRAAAGRLKKEHDRIRYTAYLMIGIVIAVILVSAFRKFWLTLDEDDTVAVGIYACSPADSWFDCTFSEMILEEEGE